MQVQKNLKNLFNESLKLISIFLFIVLSESEVLSRIQTIKLEQSNDKFLLKTSSKQKIQNNSLNQIELVSTSEFERKQKAQAQLCTNLTLELFSSFAEKPVDCVKLKQFHKFCCDTGIVTSHVLCNYSTPACDPFHQVAKQASSFQEVSSSPLSSPSLDCNNKKVNGNASFTSTLTKTQAESTSQLSYAFFVWTLTFLVWKVFL